MNRKTCRNQSQVQQFIKVPDLGTNPGSLEEENDGNPSSPAMMKPFSQNNPVMGLSTGKQSLPINVKPPPLPISTPLPTTPSQLPDISPEKVRSPSVSRAQNNSSPRSTHSDSSQTATTSRRTHVGCKYETAMARARRRVPYSLGTERLEADSSKLDVRLSKEEDAKLTEGMRRLFEQLLPPAESVERRTQLVKKLEGILRAKWPDATLNVNVFGSTGNDLGTTDSDVDLCITTDCKEMEKVCSIAELLAKSGMERVVCVSSARVPIVKVWDPILQVACDLNVNNPIALENTAMVRGYVNMDERVRPLAMIIKYWAKRRILNDAALGGTLSSYTWICLALNFLQTIEPPILPSLQDRDDLKPKILNGVNVAYDKNLVAYTDYGLRNQSSLGQLLFLFFRYYAHEFNYDGSVVSVRKGATLSKSEKGWGLLQDNRLCVEEPFNTTRNLANTADDTSMRGIHLELRRAFDLVAEGKLEACCEQYEYPAEEPKLSEHFVPPSARPVIPQPPPQTRATKSNRSSRATSHNSRNGSRKSSNPNGRSAINPSYLRNLPFQMTTQELQAQAQHQQHLLHDQLFQQYQYLQAQEQELRMQLHQQNLRSRGLLSSGSYSPTTFGPYPTQEEVLEIMSSSQFSANGITPLSAPLYQQRFGSPSPYQMPASLSTTNPSSPHLTSSIPDARRFSRRTSLSHSTSGGSLRAHSQPARSVTMSMNFPHPLTTDSGAYDQAMGRRSSTSSASHDLTNGYPPNPFGMQGLMYENRRKTYEYHGYYIGRSPSLMSYPQSTTISPIPSHAGLAIQNGGLSPQLFNIRPSSTVPTLSPQPTQVPLDSARGQNGVNDPSSGDLGRHDSPKSRTAPLIVDGSIKSPPRRTNTHSDGGENMTFSGSTSEDFAFDTPTSSGEQSPDLSLYTGRATSPTLNPQHQLAPSKLSNGHIQEEDEMDVTRGNGVDVGDAGMQRVTDIKDARSRFRLHHRQLSAVEEVRTPSPFHDQHGNVAATSKGLNGIQSTLTMNGAVPTDQSAALTPRTNGVHPIVNVNSINGSGWQTQKKKKKGRKGNQSTLEEVANAAGGDFLPLDESLRKGG